jgi:hypothetical protein
VTGTIGGLFGAGRRGAAVTAGRGARGAGTVAGAVAGGAVVVGGTVVVVGARVVEVVVGSAAAARSRGTPSDATFPQA